MVWRFYCFMKDCEYFPFWFFAWSLDFDTNVSDKHLMHLDFLKVVVYDIIDLC